MLAGLRLHAIFTTPVLVMISSNDFLDLSGPFQLLDVRLTEDFEAAHIKGALNNCVFEVQFTQRLKETAPDKSILTIVYGAPRPSHEAEVARKKLVDNGYQEVRVLEGGISEKLDIVRGTPLPEPSAPPNGDYPLDLAECRVSWSGRNLISKHFGTIPITSGYLSFKNGVLTKGIATLDVLGIQCDDLAGTDLHDILIAHLHDDDFFDAENFPEAFVSLTELDNKVAKADLTLKGQTHEIVIPLASGITPDGRLAAQGTFSIDRTRWGIIYGSQKFFKRLAGHLVHDLIDFELRILTQPK